ncbi:MAG TPA: hypothetical protein VLT62_10360 [Candidatus Methylomirabilis sp.]|nr:hypothetical protein [Candidatus Methylomirabilis sp.]
MPDHESPQFRSDPEVRAVSDRLMVLLGNVLMDEIEKAEQEGGNILAWQFGVLDSLTKQLAGAVTACVTMIRQQGLSQSDFVVFRQRVHEQLEPAVLALLNTELARAGGEQGLPGPQVSKRPGHA